MLAGSGLALCLACASAHSGPPLITNDPDTPGDGHWEINIAAIGAYAPSAWEASAPDFDINYGVGERTQLSVHVGEAHAGEDGAPVRSGIGPVELAVRYRFLDEDTAGVALALQPRWARSWSSAAIRKGLAPEHDEFGLPLQLARHFGETTLGLELSRNFLVDEPDEWQLGVFASRDCAEHVTCLAEVNSVHADGGGTETVVDVGATREIGEHLVLMGSLGRQIVGEKRTVYYLGVQLLR